MTVEEQLAYESRVKMRQAVIAGVAAILLIGPVITQLSGVHTKVDELTLDLITEHRRFPLDLVGAIINGFGLFGLAITLNFVYQISRARNPEIKEYVRWLAIVGGVVSGIAAVVYAAVIAGKANDFVNHGTQTYMEANKLTSDGFVVALPLIAQFSSLLLTGGFIWVSLNAMRVGLLTRMMGWIGVAAGVFIIFPIAFVAPFVDAAWLVGLAYMLTGRWSSGLPPAWTTGQAEPWPTGAVLREQRGGGGGGRGAAGGRGGGGGGRGAFGGKPKPAPKVVSSTATDVNGSRDGEGDGDGAARTRANTPKRKRKHRR